MQLITRKQKYSFGRKSVLWQIMKNSWAFFLRSPKTFLNKVCMSKWVMNSINFHKSKSNPQGWLTKIFMHCLWIMKIQNEFSAKIGIIWRLVIMEKIIVWARIFYILYASISYLPTVFSTLWAMWWTVNSAFNRRIVLLDNKNDEWNTKLRQRIVFNHILPETDKPKSIWLLEFSIFREKSK